VRTLLLLRSFLIQGSWNYRTMVGTGLGWALLPALRRRAGEDRASVLKRHLAHFNGHPYLMTVALGALAREEIDGTDPERVARFRTVLPAPLGSLGDALIWAAWRPACLVGGLLAAALGLGAVWVLTGLLLIYNGLHMALRVWGIRVGWTEGLDVGRALGAARLSLWAERIGRVGVLVLGLLLGLFVVHGFTVAGWGFFWLAAVGAFLAIGLRGGVATGRRGSMLLLVVIVSGFIWGGMDGGAFFAGNAGSDP
jgi:mannose PTS system EIID component